MKLLSAFMFSALCAFALQAQQLPMPPEVKPGGRVTFDLRVKDRRAYGVTAYASCGQRLGDTLTTWLSERTRQGRFTVEFHVPPGWPPGYCMLSGLAVYSDGKRKLRVYNLPGVRGFEVTK
jgi:hypothetical protein